MDGNQKNRFYLDYEDLLAANFDEELDTMDDSVRFEGLGGMFTDKLDIGRVLDG